jgi:tripartite-type tricarboxylate transporter receptor subunit TctC
MIHFQRLATHACVVTTALMVCAGAAAQGYPAKPIRFISPFLPGGSQDVIARSVGGKLAERVGQQVVVDNRSGAAGIIAAELTARAPADGYTILMVTAGPITIAPSLNRKLSYDPSSIAD